MDNETTPSPDYIKGYNEGYIIHKYEPQLAQDLSKAIDKSERGTGFKDGASYIAPDKDKAYIPQFLREDRLDDFYKKTPEPDKDRDIELDRE